MKKKCDWLTRVIHLLKKRLDTYSKKVYISCMIQILGVTNENEYIGQTGKKVPS